MKKSFYRIIAVILIIVSCIMNFETVKADENETIRVGIYQMEGFHSYNEYGDIEGYCIDYLNVVAGINRWTFEYVEVEDFMDGCNKLEAGEIDLIAPAMMTDARKEKFAYSELNFGTEYTVLVTDQARTDLYYEDYEHFNGMKVAVLHNYPLTEYFITYMKTHGFSAELVYFNTIEESKAALDNGQVDALVDSIMDMRSDAKLLARFTPQPFYFLLNKKNTELLARLDSAMYQVQNTYPTLLDELLVNYYPVYELQFYTRAELEYVQKAESLKVAYVPARKPLSFQNEDGELDGISRAIFDKIAELSGLKFEYVQLPEGDITYRYLQEQEVDLITGVEYNSANMNSKGIFLSHPYISARKVMVSRPEFKYDETKTYKLAVATGSQTVKKVLNSKYPNLEIVDYETNGQCFEALYDGEVDMLIQNQYVVDTILAKPIYSTFQVVPIDGLEDELCFSTIVNLNGNYGMTEEESSLVIGILNKAISHITDTEMDNMVMRETAENQYELEIADFLYSYRVTIMVVLAALVILGIFVVFYLREKREVAKLKVLQLEHKTRTDLLTGLLNKQTFEKEVREYVDNHSTENSCFVFLDMDHFKEINDQFGHSIGDQVIKETAKKIQLLFANFDLVGRFGGDEFCVFVKEIPRDTLIDKLQFAVKKMEQEYAYEGGTVKVSASIGAAYCQKEKVGYKELMDVADAAAYQAKDSGRNCYIIKDVE